MKIKNPKITMIKFAAKEVKQADVTRFNNLIIKLGAKFETFKTDISKLKGKTANLVILDEAEEMSKEEWDIIMENK